MKIKCNHCGFVMDVDLLDIDSDFSKLESSVNGADRMIECEECQCEVFYNCKTCEVIVL